MNNNNKDPIFTHHLGNLTRAVSGNGINKYNYILSKDELLQSYFDTRQDNYKLRKEVKRSRYVYSGSGLQTELEEICNNAITVAASAMADMVAQDSVNQIEAALNGLTQAANGTIKLGATGKSSIDTSKFSQILARELGKGLVKSGERIIRELSGVD